MGTRRGPKLCLVDVEAIMNQSSDDEKSSNEDNEKSSQEMDDKSLIDEGEEWEDDVWTALDEEYNPECLLNRTGTADGEEVVVDNIADSDTSESESLEANSIDELMESELVDSKNGDNLQKKRGKPTSEVWESFDLKQQGKIKVAMCKKCKKQVSGQAQRLRSHLTQCGKKKQVKSRESAQKSFLYAPKPDTPERGSSVKHQPKANSFTIAIGSKQKKEIDLMLGRFIYSGNIPFRAVDNHYFHEFVRLLNPAYKVPSRQTISNEVLNTVYKEVNDNMKMDLNGKKGVLLQDGWSTSQNEPIISHCINVLDKVHFLSAESTTNNPKTAEYCFQLLENAIEKSENSYNCKIVGVVTDNNNTMLAMQRLLRDKYPGIHAYGCNAHLFNLLGNKFSSQELQANIVLVQKYMKYHHIPSAELKFAGGKRPILPTSTRWNSQLDCLVNYIENHDKYLGIARKLSTPTAKEEKEKLKKVLAILEDSSVYNKVKDETSILQPIALALDKAQSQDSTIADTTVCWLQLIETLPDSITSSEYFQKQFKLGVTPLSIAAMLLTPKYKNSNIPTKLKNDGLNWLADRSNMFVVYATEICDKSSEFFFESFQSEEIFGKISAVKWWQNAATPIVSQNMIDLATTILSLPASTGALERCFSDMGNIMSVKRSKLGIEKTAKLCSITNSLKVSASKLSKCQRAEYKE